MTYKIIKQGFDKSGNQRYSLKYNGKRIKTSIDKSQLDNIIKYKLERQDGKDFIIKINRVFDGIEKPDVEFIQKFSEFKYNKINANILKNIIYNKQNGCCIVTNEKISFEEGTLHHILPRNCYPNKTFLLDNCVFIQTDIENLYHKIYRENINLNTLINFIYRYRTNKIVL